LRWGWWLAAGSGAGRARGFLVVWPLVETITHHLAPTEAIPNAPYHLFSVRFGPYQGPPVTLPDGVTIETGQRVGELHFENSNVMRLMNTAPVWELVKQLDGDLKALAAWFQTKELEDVRALWGVTLLSAVAERKGFLVRQRPITFHARLERFFMEGLLVLYSQEGIRRMTHGTTPTHYPEEVWIARATFLRRYQAKAPPATTQTPSDG
jgi:hypothetical protein